MTERGPNTSEGIAFAMWLAFIVGMLLMMGDGVAGVDAC